MHFVPEKFDLQVHTPLDEQEVEDDPELLHPQAEKIDIVNETISHELAK